MTLNCTAAYLFFADLLCSMNQQPANVVFKCLPKAKNDTRKGFAGERTKICVPAGTELIKRHAKRELISKRCSYLESTDEDIYILC